MSTKLLTTTLLILFSLTGHTALIQVDGSGEHYYGQDPVDPMFRFRAIYDTETPGIAESPARVTYLNALSSLVVWSSLASTPFNPTDRRLEFQSGALLVANDQPDSGSKSDSFILASDIANVNGIDDLRAGFFLGTFNLSAVSSTQIPLTLELSDFENAVFFLSTPSSTMANTFEAFQAGIITSLTFTPLDSAAVPETSTTTLLGVGLFGLFLRRRRREMQGP